MIWILIAAAVCAVDAAAKFFVNRDRADGSVLYLAGGKISIGRLINRAGAFGTFKEHPAFIRIGSLLAFLLSCAALCAAVIKKDDAVKKAGLAMIAGGGLGNLAERLGKGGVTDFLRFHIGSRKLENYVFNPADLFIFLGTILTMAAMLKDKGKKL